MHIDIWFDGWGVSILLHILVNVKTPWPEIFQEIIPVMVFWECPAMVAWIKCVQRFVFFIFIFAVISVFPFYCNLKCSYSRFGISDLWHGGHFSTFESHIGCSRAW